MTEIGPRMLVNVLLDLLPRPTVRANSLAPSANWDDSAKRLEFLFVLRHQHPALPSSAAARLRSWNTISQTVNTTMARVVRNPHLSTGPGGDRMPPTTRHSEATTPAQVNCVVVHATATIQTSGTFNSH